MRRQTVRSAVAAAVSNKTIRENAFVFIFVSVLFVKSIIIILLNCYRTVSNKGTKRFFEKNLKIDLTKAETNDNMFI